MCTGCRSVEEARISEEIVQLLRESGRAGVLSTCQRDYFSKAALRMSLDSRELGIRGDRLAHQPSLRATHLLRETKNE
jgi:hypothetical protein